MLLTVTMDSEELKRVLDLAWGGVRRAIDDPLLRLDYDLKADKKILESFRAECETAKGGKL